MRISRRKCGPPAAPTLRRRGRPRPIARIRRRDKCTPLKGKRAREARRSIRVAAAKAAGTRRASTRATRSIERPRRPAPLMHRFVAALFASLAFPVLAFDLEGHRGARGLAPENTLAAFRKAIEIGVTTIETDMAVTSDG